MTGPLALRRERLASLPTPLQAAPRLSDALGVEVWLKRDDLTGLGLGGNKVRALEYLLAEALANGCDCLVTGAGPQSNWAALAAVAARRCGLEPFLVRYGDAVPETGNLLLSRMVGAVARWTHVPDRSSVDAGIGAVAAELRAGGRTPYCLPRGGATALGAVGYLWAGAELVGQLHDIDAAPAALWLATGSCATQAGLVASAAWLCTSYTVIGVTVSRPQSECEDRVGSLARGAARLAGTAEPTGAVTVLDGWVGPGYGRPSDAGHAAAELTARAEGVVLDPVFGAKAMAALTSAARAGQVTGPVVFLVTGGAPTVFAGGSL